MSTDWLRRPTMRFAPPVEREYRAHLSQQLPLLLFWISVLALLAYGVLAGLVTSLADPVADASPVAQSCYWQARIGAYLERFRSCGRPDSGRGSRELPARGWQHHGTLGAHTLHGWPE